MSVHGGKIACTECEDGRVEVMKMGGYSPNATEPHYYWTDCDVCHATGEITVDVICPVCGKDAESVDCKCTEAMYAAKGIDFEDFWEAAG